MPEVEYPVLAGAKLPYVVHLFCPSPRNETLRAFLPEAFNECPDSRRLGLLPRVINAPYVLLIGNGAVGPLMEGNWVHVHEYNPYGYACQSAWDGPVPEFKGWPMAPSSARLAHESGGGDGAGVADLCQPDAQVCRNCAATTYEALQVAEPQFEDGSAYRQLRPTRLDKIKNLHLELQAGGVGTGASSIALRPAANFRLTHSLDPARVAIRPAAAGHVSESAVCRQQAGTMVWPTA